MKHKIKTSYKHQTDAELAKLGSRILESLKDNPNFPIPTPARPDIEQALQEFQQALSVAGRQDRTRVSAKNDKKAILEELLGDLSVYIETTSQGDKTMLLSSGFDITGVKATPLALPPIEDFNVEIGMPGQATTRVKPVTGARSYVHQFTADPITSDSIWVSETMTERRHTFSNLSSVTRYWFRVIAIGRGRQMVYSATVARVIQ